jgi:hypothetical protein
MESDGKGSHSVWAKQWVPILHFFKHYNNNPIIFRIAPKNTNVLRNCRHITHNVSGDRHWLHM